MEEMIKRFDRNFWKGEWILYAAETKHCGIRLGSQEQTKIKISPYFCKWSEGMLVLTNTPPWPADQSKSDEHFSDPRLATHAVKYRQVLAGCASMDDSRGSYLPKEVEILRSKPNLSASINLPSDHGNSH